MKRRLKRSAQLMTARAAPVVWRVRRNALVVLMYHRVLPRGDRRLRSEQPGMWVHPDTFAMHLRTLRRHFEVVRLADWVERARNNKPLPALACAITFDDGWRDNYEHAYPILKAEEVPATIFVCSDFIGTEKCFWPEQLALLLRVWADAGRDECRNISWLQELVPALDSHGSTIGIDSIDQAIEAAKKRHSDESISRLLDEAVAGIGAHDACQDHALLDWDQVQEMLDSRIVELGSHTRTHTRLSKELGEHSMRDQIIGSRRALEARTGRPIELFCYPNGDITAEAYDMVKATYSGACSTEKGWHFPDGDQYAIRRISVHQDVACDSASFLSRVSGWL